MIIGGWSLFCWFHRSLLYGVHGQMWGLEMSWWLYFSRLKYRNQLRAIPLKKHGFCHPTGQKTVISLPLGHKTGFLPPWTCFVQFHPPRTVFPADLTPSDCFLSMLPLSKLPMFLHGPLFKLLTVTVRSSTSNMLPAYWLRQLRQTCNVLKQTSNR